MERYKKVRRRRLAAFIVLLGIAVWIGGCATGRSLGLSALMSSMAKESVLQSEYSPGATVAEKVEGSTAGYVVDVNDKVEDTEKPERHEQTRDVGSPKNAVDISDSIAVSKPKSKDKLVALTFDDGPDLRYTPAILDILKEKGVEATFFVVGTQVNKYPEVVMRMVEEGHAIGNHTSSHKDLSKLSKSGIIEQITSADEVIQNTLGYVPSLFRAPYGAVSDTLRRVVEEKGLRMVGWTVDTRDWAGTSINQMRSVIRNQTKPNGIILMHSFGGKHIRNTVEMLPAVIDDLHKLGYKLVTVDQIPVRESGVAWKKIR